MAVPQDVKLARHAGDLDDDGHDTIGTTWKSPCRAATTANITIATALNNGDSLDGVTLATGDRVLVKNQSTGAQNGIYVVGASPARATDYDSSVDIVGSVIVVTEGTTNADTAWQCTTNATITVGTTTLVFAAFGGGGDAPFVIDDTSYSDSGARLVAPEDFIGASPTDVANRDALIYMFGEVGGVLIDIYAYDNDSGNSAELYMDATNGKTKDASTFGLVFSRRSSDPGSGDSENGQIYYSNATETFRGRAHGAWRDLGPGGIARIVAAAAIANTETVVAAYSMPAGFMVVGTTFHIKAYGRLTTGATAGSSIFRCRIGTTTLTGNIPASLTIANAALVTNAPFVLDMLVTVRTAGASGTAIGNVSVNGGVTGAFTVVDDISIISATVVVDTTATKRVELTYISGNAGTTATFENAVIEIANA